MCYICNRSTPSWMWCTYASVYRINKIYRYTVCKICNKTQTGFISYKSVNIIKISCSCKSHSCHIIINSNHIGSMCLFCTNTVFRLNIHCIKKQFIILIYIFIIIAPVKRKIHAWIYSFAHSTISCWKMKSDPVKFIKWCKLNIRNSILLWYSCGIINHSSF